MTPTTNLRRGFIALVSVFLFFSFTSLTAVNASLLDEAGSVGEEQIKEKQELGNMRSEMDGITKEIDGALNELQNLTKKYQSNANAKVFEMHLFARESKCAPLKGQSVNCLTYNGKIPGPVIRVRQGTRVKVVLHNQLKTSTSLYFHGLRAPHQVNGLPRKGAGIVPPGESFIYQFIANNSGTFWYHPQVVHANQRLKGLYGVLIVEPKLRSRPYDKDITLVFSKLSSKKITRTVKSKSTKTAKTVSEDVAIAPTSKHDEDLEVAFLVNGKQAPQIPPIELRRGQRVKLRLINSSDEVVPVHLTGHKLEVISTNGGDKLEPHYFRDSITLNPSDRVDAEFIANNPGVWSLASELFYQASSNGKFPGGIALVVRYSEAKARQ